MLEFVKGDFFDFDADIRINTVNCVGVMGAGVALAFKNKYPEMFKDYVKGCKSGELKPGNPIAWSNGDMFFKGIEIINFPTKDHWRRPSKYEYVESGLRWLAHYLKDKENKIVTLPALGCGHGGLEWEKVRKLIANHLKNSPAKILVFEPSSSKNAGKASYNLNNSLSKLSDVGVRIINDKSSSYPDCLRRYTEKNLYFLGNDAKNIEFDVALICSSKPINLERQVVRQFVDFCLSNELSVLFGGSVFEKKLAIECSAHGLVVGVFIPAGIYQSAKKIRGQESYSNIKLLSIGNPFEGFDRKAYLPSVLSRMFITRQTLFTTGRLAWLSKHRKKLIKENISSYFIHYEGINELDVEAALDINSNEIPFDLATDTHIFDRVLP